MRSSFHAAQYCANAFAESSRARAGRSRQPERRTAPGLDRESAVRRVLGLRGLAVPERFFALSNELGDGVRRGAALELAQAGRVRRAQLGRLEEVEGLGPRTLPGRRFAASREERRGLDPALERLPAGRSRFFDPARLEERLDSPDGRGRRLRRGLERAERVGRTSPPKKVPARFHGGRERPGETRSRIEQVRGKRAFRNRRTAENGSDGHQRDRAEGAEPHGTGGTGAGGRCVSARMHAIACL